MWLETGGGGGGVHLIHIRAINNSFSPVFYLSTPITISISSVDYKLEKEGEIIEKKWGKKRILKGELEANYKIGEGD